MAPPYFVEDTTIVDGDGRHLRQIFDAAQNSRPVLWSMPVHHDKKTALPAGLTDRFSAKHLKNS